MGTIWASGGRGRPAAAPRAPGAPRARTAAVLGLASCLLPAIPAAASARDLTVARSSFAGRVVEVIAEGSGDQGVDIRQEDGRLRVEAGGHRVTITAGGAIRVDGVERPAIASETITIVIRDAGVELRPGLASP